MKPKKIDVATGRPYERGKGSLAHLAPRRRRSWAPARPSMALDESYDAEGGQPPAGDNP